MKKIIITGKVHNAPQITHSENGDTCAIFSVEVGKDKYAELITILCKGKLIEYVTRFDNIGRNILVVGSPFCKDNTITIYATTIEL